MQLTNMELFNAKEPLKNLVSLKFPVKTSLGLAKLVQKVNEHLVPAEQVKEGLVKTYGTLNPEDANQMTVQPGDENWPKFAQEFGELLAQSVEIVFDKVALPETLEVEPATILALEKFVIIA